MKFERLITLFQDTHNDLQGKAAHSVDVALVVRNWLFGWYIVEYEQQGEDRAKYGVKLICHLSLSAFSSCPYTDEQTNPTARIVKTIVMFFAFFISVSPLLLPLLVYVKILFQFLRDQTW